MKSRPVWFRVLAALWGIWFATALTEPAGFLACPMHSVAASSVAGTDSGTAPAVREHHASAASSTSAPYGHQHTGNAPSAPDTPHDCTCLSHCCGIAADVAGPVQESWTFASTLVHVRVGATPYASHQPTPVAHLRPYANGPPRLAA